MSLRKIKFLSITDFDNDLFPFGFTHVNSPFVFNANGVIEGITTPGGYTRYNGGGFINRDSWISSSIGIWWDHSFSLTLRCVK